MENSEIVQIKCQAKMDWWWPIIIENLTLAEEALAGLTFNETKLTRALGSTLLYEIDNSKHTIYKYNIFHIYLYIYIYNNLYNNCFVE